MPLSFWNEAVDAPPGKRLTELSRTSGIAKRANPHQKQLATVCRLYWCDLQPKRAEQVRIAPFDRRPTSTDLLRRRVRPELNLSIANRLRWNANALDSRIGR